jgi:type 1 glutamine amidotransferase
MYPERAVPSALSTGISDTMSAEQDSAFKNWLLTGKGYIGVHCDTRLNNDWPWFYQTFFGAKYVNDIGPQNSTFHVADPKEFLTQGIPANFTGNEQLRVDSLYFTESDTSYKVLIRGDVNDYPAGQKWMPFFPFVYRHNYRNARMFHLAPGHNATTWTAANSYWTKLFLNGILYALNRPGYGTTGIAEGPAPMGYALQRLDRGREPSLRYAVPRRAHVVIRLFDSHGRLIAKLADGMREAGSYSVALPAGARGSLGLVDFRAGSFRKGMKIVL